MEIEKIEDIEVEDYRFEVEEDSEGVIFNIVPTGTLEEEGYDTLCICYGHGLKELYEIIGKALKLGDKNVKD